MNVLIDTLTVLVFMMKNRKRLTCRDINILQDELDEKFDGHIVLDVSSQIINWTALSRPNLFKLNIDFSISKADDFDHDYEVMGLYKHHSSKIPRRYRKRVIEMLLKAPKLKIVSCAVMNLTDNEYRTGHDHDTAWEAWRDDPDLNYMLPLNKEWKEGFIIDDGRFVDRTEAAKIAIEAGQLALGCNREIHQLNSYQIDWKA